MQCPYCDLRFTSLSTKANHVRWYHKRQATQTRCEFCSVMFEAPNLRAHLVKCTRAITFHWCDGCGKSTPNARFCSKSCSAVANNKAGAIGYASYRKNNAIVRTQTYHDICFEHWPRSCVICGWDVSVDVHHIDDNHGNDERTNLIPLCQNHHTMTRMKAHANVMRVRLLEIVAAKFGALTQRESATSAG